MKQNRNRVKEGATTATDGRSNDYDPFKLGVCVQAQTLKLNRLRDR